MTKRAAILLLGIAVLSGWGMPFHPPCCGFRDSARPVVQSNCCPVEGCPLAQARGAAPASIAKSPSLDTALLTIEFGVTIGTIPQLGAQNFPLLASSRSSPPRCRPSPALLSVFRI